MKLNQRIIMIVVAPLIISTVISTVIITQITNEQLLDSTLTKIDALCKLTESELRNPLNNLDVDAINEIIDNLEENDEIIQVLVLFPDGRLLTDGTDHDYNFGTISEDKFVQKSISSDIELRAIDDEVIRISKPIILGEKIGIFVLDYSIKNINSMMSNSINDIIIITLGIITVSIVFSVFLSRSISKPILKIKDNVDAIAEGKLENKIIKSKIPEINGLSKNISEMVDKIEQYQKELVKSERLTTIGEMSSRVTHDLRNPLTTLKNSLEIMKVKNPEVIKENKKYFDMMEDAVSRMGHQIDEVLGFVKVKEPIKKIVELNEVLDSVMKTIEIPNNIKISITKNDLEIWCDKNQIQNVLVNLISNSIQAIDDKEGEIKVKSEKIEDYDKITVEDNGEGIPEKSLETIFEPLYTTKASGTGLGLVSCKNTILAHKGEIYAQNSPKGGAIFTILLPNARESKKD